MGIYSALSTAVTGLQAQSFALENISGNIANSQTTGFKRVETSFVDMVPDGTPTKLAAGSVVANARATNTVQGDISSTQVSTNMAINGNGFFVVQKKTGQVDGNSIFAGSNLYTRRGDFTMDKEGYLVNGAGNYLEGLPIDPTTGNISGSVPSVIKISNAVLPALPTTQIQYQLNLPQTPADANYSADTPDSELIKASSFTPPSLTTISADDNNTFLDSSISGGAVTAYAANGSPVNVQLRWAKTDSAASGGTDTWNLFYMSDSTATGTSPEWTNVGTDYKFGADGAANPAVPTTTISNLTVDGVSLGSMTLQHGTNGLTQFADTSGTASVTTLSQNGYAAGKFSSVAIDGSGRIIAAYTNGQQATVAQVVTASFNGADSLKRLDGGTFSETTESGGPVFTSDPTISGSALEASNTDISTEFSNLIVTQQAYAAGTKIVTTANDMLQQALNMIR